MKRFWKILLIIVAVVVVLLVALGLLFGSDTEEAIDTAPEQASGAKPDSQSAETAADFTVYDADGGVVTLSEHFGKPIVVNFWATWCGPCCSELPHFDEAYSAYSDQIEFMMVNLTDDTETVKTFLSENGYSFPVYYDSDSSSATAYNINSIPLTVIIDKTGAIVASQVGSMDAATLQGYLDLVLE